MKKLRLVSSLVLLFIATAVAAKPLVDIQHWQTDNGLRVYFVKSSTLPMLDIRMAFAAGSAHDGDKFGLAQLTNNLLGEATSKFDADQIADQFDKLGAITSGSVNRDQAIVSLRTLTHKDTLKSALDLFTNVLTDAAFPKANLKRIKQQTLLGLQQAQQQPNAVADDAFYKALYPHSAYAHPVAGDPKHVKALQPNDVKQFYQTYYVASNAVLVMVGDLTNKQAKQIAKKIASRLPKGKPVASIELQTVATKQLQQSIDFPSSQTTIRLGQVGINYHDPSYFPLIVGNYILGGGGFVSRLFDAIRVKKGFAYGIYSYFIPLQANGPFMVVLQTRNQVANQALTLTRQLLTEFIQQGPTPDELASAKRNITGSFALRLSSNGQIADQVLNIAFYQLPLTYLDTYREKVNAVTLSDIQHAFTKTVDPNIMVTITVGQPG